MIEEDCVGEESPIKSGGNGQQFGSPVQGVSGSSASSSSNVTWGGTPWGLSYEFFLENVVNEENKIVNPPTPVCGIVSADDDDDLTDGVGNKTLTELVGVPDQSYEASVENQELQDHDREDSANVHERQGSETSFSGEPLPPGGSEGWTSPCLSQRTSSSIRNLFNDVEEMQNSVSNINDIMQLGCTGVSEKLHQILMQHFSDEHATKRFLSHTIKDAMCTSFYKGVCQPDSDEAHKLENEFSEVASKDKNKLMGIIGKVLLEKYYASLESGETQGSFSEDLGMPDLGNISSAVNIPSAIQVGNEVGLQLHQPTFEVKQTLDVKPNLVNGLSCVPDYVPAAELGEPSTSKKGRKQTTVQKVRVSKEEIWDVANHVKREHADEEKKDRQLEKIGIVFYEDIFTDDEKQTCTVSGKNNTPRFDQIKLSFIRAAIAFILTDPSKRNTKAFEKARKEKGFKDLTKSQYDTFKKKVLTEYACRKRNKKN